MSCKYKICEDVFSAPRVGIYVYNNNNTIQYRSAGRARNYHMDGCSVRIVITAAAAAFACLSSRFGPCTGITAIIIYYNSPQIVNVHNIIIIFCIFRVLPSLLLLLLLFVSNIITQYYSTVLYSNIMYIRFFFFFVQRQLHGLCNNFTMYILL